MFLSSKAFVASERLKYFKGSCGDKKLNQFVDIFLPMLYQENNARLEISNGKIISPSKFQSHLSLVTHKFNVGVQFMKDTPQLILNNLNERHMIALFNLAEIRNLCIDSEEGRHSISFNYNNQNDYKIHINS